MVPSLRKSIKVWYSKAQVRWGLGSIELGLGKPAALKQVHVSVSEGRISCLQFKGTLATLGMGLRLKV